MPREDIKPWIVHLVVVLVVAASSSFVDSATSPMESNQDTVLISSTTDSDGSGNTGVSSISSNDNNEGSTQRKRAVEEIYFGNQQNPSVGLFDDPGFLGSFPSSESGADDDDVAVEDSSELQQELNVDLGSGTSSELKNDQAQEQLEEDDKTEEPMGPQIPSTPYRSGPHLGALYRNFYSPIRVARAPRLGVQSPYSNAWDLPFLLQEQPLPVRRRRSTPRSSPGHSSEVPARVLAAGRRQKRELGGGHRFDFSREISRFQKDPEFAQMLASIMESELDAEDDYDPEYAVNKRRLPQGMQAYGAAPRSNLGPMALLPSPSRTHSTRYAVQQPTEDDVTNLALSLLRQHQPQSAYPAEHPVMYRRSGLIPGPKYRYMAMPGLKRSSAPTPGTSIFNQRQPAKQKRTSSDNGGVYSLAAMLGAEKDQMIQRIRRVAM
ncbi:uncharacterized protein LOC143029755 [Oratosquilla oratoria]|uniref:uncharacterized protein LOC143029755 n=1 Tax=Oratosquilla oratoria TaxID=337810 RepID=UPI003F76521B